MSQADFTQVVLTFTQSLNKQDEIILLSDVDSTPSDFVLHKDDSEDLKDPPSLKHAMKSKYWPKWLTAIHEENESLKAKEVYEAQRKKIPSPAPIGTSDE